MWLLTNKSILWCFVIQNPMWTIVQDVENNIACFYLNTHEELHVMKRGLCHPSDGSILTFCHPLLLWVIWYWKLPLHPYFPIKNIKVFGGVLFFIIKPKHLDPLPSLIFIPGFESTKFTVNFIFCLHKINQELQRGIINAGNMIQFTSQQRGRHWSTYITMY